MDKKIILGLVAIGLICLIVISISAFDPIGWIQGLFRKEPEGPKKIENLFVTGRVGIGTMSPKEKLEIVGNVKVAGNYIFLGGDGFWYQDGLNSVFQLPPEGGQWQFKDPEGAVKAAIDDNGNSFSIGGNVGIGTTEPQSKLHIKSDDIRVGDIGFGELDRDMWFNGGTDGIFVLSNTGNKTTGKTIIQHWNGTTATYGLTIANNGNVGVGTTSPSAKLDINDGGAASGARFLEVGDDSFLTDIDMSDTLGIYGQQDSTKAHIKLGSDGPMISGVSGNVGIGIDNPEAKLHVAGDVMIDSGGSANKVVCWKADGKTLGYCSDQPGADGSCICN